MILKLSDLKAVLARVKPAVSSRTTLPALNCVKLTQQKESCRFLASDGDQWLETACPAEASHPGASCCVRYDRLEKAVKFWVADTVTFTANEAGTAITAKCGAYSLPLPVLSAAEMPEPPKTNGEPVLVPDFAAKLKRLLPFTSDNETQPAWGAIHLGPNFMEAANGRSLARMETDFDGRGFLFPSNVVPSVAAGDAVLHIGTNLIAVSAGDATLTAKRIEGVYPSTDTIFKPLDGCQLVTCWRKELLSAVEYCEGQSKNGQWTNVWLDMQPTKLSVALSKADADGESCSKELPCKTEQPLRVALGAGRLADLLRAFEEDEIALAFDGIREPVAISQKGTQAVLLLSRIEH